MATNRISVRILVADDNGMLRAGMCTLLRSHECWTVCGEAADGTDAVEKAIALNPDVVLLDISMPYLNGLEAAKQIHKWVPASKILIVTEHDAKTLENMPAQPGVSGYVMKSRLNFDLISAIEGSSEALRRELISKKADGTKCPLEGKEEEKYTCDVFNVPGTTGV